MSSAGSVSDRATPPQVNTTLTTTSLPVSTDTHSNEDKGGPDLATDENNPLQRSLTNPVAAVDPAAQLQHVGTDVDEELDPEKGPAVSEKEDPNIVDFNGPDDPEKAVNWSPKRKYSMLALISVMTFITPLASSMFAPGVPEVLRDFRSTNHTLGSFVVSVYVLGYAIGPLVVAPCSEAYGRLPVYHTANILFIIFTIACAVSSNLNMLIGFRFLEGMAGSAPITIGGGTIADLFIQEQRGGALAIWSMGPLIGPVVGPVTGGFLAKAEGWRWVFWVITMAAGVVTIAFFFLLRETYASTILEKKTERLRKDTGNPDLRSKLHSGLTPLGNFKASIVRPLKMLWLSPIVMILSMMMAFTYGVLYLLFTTITEVFEGEYGFSGGIVGLTYLGIGIGMFTGLAFFGTMSDRALKKKKAAGLEMKPEHRLPLLIPGAFCVPIGLFIYGWTAQYHVFWFVPIFGTSFVGVGLIATFMPIQSYLVDAFTIYASSAIAACTILRSILGALLPLAGPSMYNALGYGWGNSLLGFLALAMVPVPFLLIKYGEAIRTNPRFQVKL